jgi:hypothetical protein
MKEEQVEIGALKCKIKRPIALKFLIIWFEVQMRYKK